MDQQAPSSRLRGWLVLMFSGLAAVICLVSVAFFPDLLILFFFVLFVLSMTFLILELIGAKTHGDEWVDWRTEPVEPIAGLHDEPERAPLFRDVADPETFPRRLTTAWKRRVPLKKRNRFFSNRRFPNE